MSATQDYVALEWIRGELSNTLHNAQLALEAVAETPDDAASMRSCLTAIHQVHGTLKMVQLEGPTQVAAEMEQVAQSLMNSSVPEVTAAQETLMQAILQLPAYLDRLHREQKDAEGNYLPMVNNLRAARGEERIPGAEPAEGGGGGGPDMSPLTMAPGDDVINAFFQADGEGNLPKIRARYQQSLGAIFKKTDVRENLTTIGKLFTMLIRLCGNSPTGNLAELGLAVIEGIANGGIKLDNNAATLLKKTGEHLKSLAEKGQNGLADPVREDLALGMVDLIQGAQKETKRISALKELYASVAPELEEIAIGPDEETMSAVASILIEELNGVTDKLDLYVRAQNRNVDDLVALLPNLEQIASTMVVLGNNDQQGTVAKQIDVIREIEQSGEPEEDVLLPMAEALLEVGASLGSLVMDSGEAGDGDAFANLDEAQAAVVRETRTALSAAKDAVIDFIASDFDQGKLTDLPDSLRALRGGLIIVNQSRAGDVLESAANYVSISLLAGSANPPLEQMDDLADAITSVDYFLERLLENAGDPYLQMLEVAETAVEKLGYPAGEEPAVPSQAVSEEPAVVETPAVEEIEAAAEPLEVDTPSGKEDDLIDDEILEIFVDEVDEVLETIHEFLPQWEQEPTNQEALTEVRRAFHTLKGSGRMVGATVVGELAWSIENLLNRVIDDTVRADAAVMDIVAKVVASVPEGVDAFKAGQQDRFKPDAMAAVADALAQGRTPPTITDPPAAAAESEPAAETAVEPDIEASALEDIEALEGSEDAPELEDIEFDAVEEVEVDAESDVELEEIALEAPEADVEEAFDIEEIAFSEEPAEESIEEMVEIEEVEAIVEDEEVEEPELKTVEREASEEDIDFGLVEEIVEEDSFELDDVVLEVEAPAAEVEEPSAGEESVEEVTDSSADALLEDDDLDLEQIFAIEADEKLCVIEEFVRSPEVSGDLVAAFHTLKGSSAMAEIDSIHAIAGPMEHLANDYLIQNKTADDRLIESSRMAAGLIRKVLTDIDGLRDSVQGTDALLALISAGAESEAAPEPEATFDFENIKLLSEANIAADGWQDVDALVAEMKQALEQAESLGQPDLAALLTAMLRIYSEATEKPDDLTLALMMRAHDHLVFMFDAIASSQQVRPADRVINDLNAVDLAPAAAEDPVVTEESAASVTQLPEDSIDEDILPIFLEETEELLEELDESIVGWSESGHPAEHLDNLLRQLHTLKGGARMAGIASLGEYTHNFETFLIGVQSSPVDFDDEFFALLNSQQDEIIRRVEIYQKVAAGGATVEELESLKTAPVPGAPAAAQAEPEPEAASAAETESSAEPEEQPSSVPASAVVTENVVDLPEDDVDADILPIFLEESDDLVEELESSIQSWSESPGDMDTLDVLLRNLHTLKGGARMAGLNSLGEYAHNFETFLIGIQQNPVELDDDFFTLLAKRQDEVIRRVEIYKALSVGAVSEDDLASLKQAIEPTLEAEPEDITETSAAAPASGPTPEVAEKAAPPQEKAASANQEMVRVAADLLEELIGLAGESSITRGRVEQQITDFGESLQEMEETINRIRDQVRRLEIEAESRETLIRSSQSESSFDELEMDRYTMLQTISRALNEATSDMMDLKDTLGNRSRDAETLLHQQARISSELQEGLTRTSMVPFARLIPRLRRIVRQVSGEVGKSVRFDAYNVEGELDRNVLERIVAPLEHMLRNAVDHGIEDREIRAEAGKPEQGRISLRLSREGGYVVLTISDDGGGINVDAVRGKAIERGIITEDQEVSDHEVMQFIMHAGFSTAQKLTQISGRGVGMDVVGSEIKALGGDITIDSAFGKGTEFQIRIPFTVSINRALMVVVREETYAVPLNTIEGIVRVSPYELEAYYQPDAPMFEYAGQPYRLAYMGKMLDKSEDPNLSGQVAPLPVILARSGDNAVALQVDRVIGSREVVVKTLGSQFSDVGGISGATVLGDGSVVIILDCMALVRSFEASASDLPETEVVEEATPDQISGVRTVMIVDDSVTVRKVTSRLMERQGFEVATAKDGVDAMNQLQDIRPDVVLLDIEMPRMDGFEVLRSVRRDDNLKDLPIIMITSRTGEKHKQQAMELGVNQYLGKPFQEANLLATIDEVIESAKSKPEG
ncbi:MAG: Hpt domain-containing protein [Pseudomonadales bacterium]|nr:Hpt domain-containing protein [Pseudomonadales bacterium]MBO7004487.1 Hpt domain-containing protein [Pseudomonadales bacterium]